MKANGRYGEEVWEKKINEQNEVGVIAGVVGSMDKIKEDTAKTMKEIDYFVIPKIKAKGKILDLGVGPLGRYAIEFAKRKFDVTGLDISKTTLEYAKKNIGKESNLNIRLVKGDMTELEKVVGKFDFIYCLATFYHIPPHLSGEVLMKINKKLKKDGYALIEFGIRKKKTIQDILHNLVY